MLPRRKVGIKVAKNCGFCDTKTNPEYKDPQTMTRYISERGKLLGKARTGLCSHHQRILTREIKKARFLALIPFVVRA